MAVNQKVLETVYSLYQTLEIESEMAAKEVVKKQEDAIEKKRIEVESETNRMNAELEKMKDDAVYMKNKSLIERINMFREWIKEDSEK